MFELFNETRGTFSPLVLLANVCVSVCVCVYVHNHLLFPSACMHIIQITSKAAHWQKICWDENNGKLLVMWRFKLKIRNEDKKVQQRDQFSFSNLSHYLEGNEKNSNFVLKCRKWKKCWKKSNFFSTRECVNGDQFLPNYITE